MNAGMWKILAIILGSLTASTGGAALIGRLSGQAYYDTELNITWLQDANLAATNTFGVAGIDPYGAMTWDKANEWIAAMNTAAYLGVSDWRLPTVTDTGSAGCTSGPWVELYPGTWGQYNAGTDCGYNVDPTTGEMAHLFHITLGNDSLYDAYFNTPASCTPLAWPVCLANTGPFSNLEHDPPAYVYWYGTTDAVDPNRAWRFAFDIGDQAPTAKVYNGGHGWAVRDGDVDVVVADADSDGVANAIDNCTLLANQTQCDSDGDGYGNHCDGDLNNNGATNAFDTPLYRAQLGQPSVGPAYNKADLNCSGGVNAFDTPIFRSLLGSGPGPSGLVP